LGFLAAIFFRAVGFAFIFIFNFVFVFVGFFFFLDLAGMRPVYHRTR